ncbi:MAG: hypothetical protein OES15_01090 [Nitrosopumilus sp.]|nr:hypothetical protein [Nitrosopumilus sp.]MDH3852870.1 hypothetical protein [Nitrosopumilus sp.]
MSSQECTCEQKDRVVTSDDEIVCGKCGIIFGYENESIMEMQGQTGKVSQDSVYGGMGSRIYDRDYTGKKVYSTNKQITKTDEKNLKYDNFEHHIQDMQKDARSRLTHQHMKNHTLICDIIRNKANRLDSESNENYSLLSKQVRKEIVKYTLKELNIPYSKSTKKKKSKKTQHDVKNISTWPIFQKESYENIYNRKKPGPKTNSKRSPYSLKKYKKYCSFCKQDRREAVSSHWQKYHKHQFSHTIMYEYFEIESIRKIKDEVIRCLKCDKEGVMYTRKNGSYFFKHEDSTQHSISKKLFTVARLDVKYGCNKKDIIFETGVTA